MFATLFGIALSHIGPRAKPVVDVLDAFTHGMFSVVGMIMRLAPLAAFGAMAFTVGKYGLGSVVSLGKLMGTMYITCFLFVAVVLGGIARLSGFSLWKFLKYIKDELFTVLGTSSSESVVPQLMRKLEHAGVVEAGGGPGRSGGPHLQPRRPVHLLHDGGDLHRPGDQHAADDDRPARVLGVLLLTSKGSAGVTGSGLHHAGRDAGLDGQDPGCGHGAAARGRPLHVGSPLDHQHDRQCRGHDRDRALGRRGRPPAADPGT